MELDIYTQRGGSDTAGYHQDTTNNTVHNYMRFLGLHFTSNVTYGTEISFLYPGEAIVNNECAFPSIRNLMVEDVIEYCKKLIWVDNLDAKRDELLNNSNYLNYYEDEVSKTIGDHLKHLIATNWMEITRGRGRVSQDIIDYYNTILCNNKSYRMIKSADGRNLSAIDNLNEEFIGFL